MNSGMGPANAARTIKCLNAQILSLKMSLQYYEDRCKLLEGIISQIDPNLIPSRKASDQKSLLALYSPVTSTSCQPAPTMDTTPELENQFLDEVLSNQSRKPNGRQWTKETKKLCFIVRSLGSKAYDYLRNYIALPCKQTLLDEFRSDLSRWGECLIEPSGLPHVCDFFRQISGVNDEDEVEIVLGIDAMAMEPLNVSKDLHEAPHNSVFFFQILPLRCEHRTFPLHLMTRSSGSAGFDVLQRIEHLCSVLKDAKIKVRAIATDGDAGYNHLHEMMFNDWIGGFAHIGVDCAVEAVSHYSMPVLSDFLHLLKNARSRVLNCRVTMCPNGDASFDAQDLNAHLRLGLALTDYSVKGRMRDIYPLELFTLENFCALYDAGLIHMALYVLPYALWVHAIRNPEMSVAMRRQFLSHVVEIFTYHLNVLGLLDRKVVSENKKEGAVQYFCSRRHAVRVCNTVMVTLVELSRGIENLALDRLGTHATECTFGLIRLLCHNKHNWKTIHRSFAKVTLLDELVNELEYPIRIRGRENIGGTKITGGDDKVFVFSEAISIALLYENSLVLINGDHEIVEYDSSLYQEIIEDIDSFVWYIKEFREECAVRGVKFAKLWHGSRAANSTILARLISFTQTTPEESQAYGLPSQSSTDESP